MKAFVLIEICLVSVLVLQGLTSAGDVSRQVATEEKVMARVATSEVTLAAFPSGDERFPPYSLPW